MIRRILSVFVLARPDMDRPTAPRFENCCRYKSGQLAPNLADSAAPLACIRQTGDVAVPDTLVIVPERRVRTQPVLEEWTTIHPESVERQTEGWPTSLRYHFPAVRALISEKGGRMRDIANWLLQLRDAAFANAPSQPILDLRGSYPHPVREPFVRSRFLKEDQNLFDD